MEDITSRILGLIKRVETNALRDLAVADKRIAKARAYALELGRATSSGSLEANAFYTIERILSGKEEDIDHLRHGRVGNDVD